MSIPTQNNITETINSLTAAINEKELSKVVGSINDLAKEINKIKPIEKPKKLEDTIRSINASIPEIVNAAKSLTDVDDSLIKKINDQFELKEKDKNGEFKTQLSTIKLINNLSEITTEIFDALNGLSEKEFDRSKIKKLEKNLTFVPAIMKGMVKALVESFNDLGEDSDNILKLLVGDGETTTNTIKTNENQETHANNVGTTIKMTENINQVTKKEGILGALNTYISLISSLGEIQAPNPMKFAFKMKLTQLSINILLNSLKKTIAVLNGVKMDGVDEKFANIEAILTDHLDTIFSTIRKMDAKKIRRDVGRIGEVFSINLPYLINNMWSLIDCEVIKKLLREDTTKAVDGLNGVIKTFDNIFKMIHDIVLNVSGFKMFIFKRKKNPFKRIENVIIKLYEFRQSILEKIQKFSESDVDKSAFDDFGDFLENLNELTENIKSAAKNILILGLLSVPLSIIFVPALLTVSIMMLFVNGTAWSLKKIQNLDTLSEGLNNLTEAVLKIALTIGALALTLIIISLAAPLLKKNVWTTVGVVVVIIAMLFGIGLLLKAADKFKIFYMVTDGSMKILLAVLAICGSMIAVALTLIVAGLLADLALPAIPSFLKLFGVTLIVLIAAVGLALVAAFLATPIFVGLAAVVLSIGALMLMSFMLTKLSEMDVPDKDKLIGNDGTVTKIKDIITSIFKALREGGGITGAGKGDRGMIGGLLNLLSPGLYNMIESIMMFGTLLMTVLSVGALMFIGNMLKSIETIDIKEGTITDNVTKIVNCVNHITNAVTAKRDIPMGDRGILGNILNLVNPGLANMVDSISALGVLMLSVISVGALAFIGKELSYIQNIKLEEDDVKNGAENIIKTVNSVVTKLTKIKINKRSIKNLNKNLEAMHDMANYLSEINKSLISIYENKLPGIGTTPDIIKAIAGEDGKDKETALMGMISTISSSDVLNKNTVEKAKWFKKILKNVYADLGDVNITKETADNSERITKNYIKFTEKLNKVDISKLETTAKMFERMSDFSKSIHGNFEKLAESINEELMPVLEELKETLNKIPDKIDTNAASVSQSISANSPIANQPSTQQGMTAQVRRENPNMSKEEVKKMVDNRLNEQARAQAQSLESKFDELIELLKSGLARVTLT